jgi:hypothetical protein
MGLDSGLVMKTHIFVVRKARNRECKLSPQEVIRGDEVMVFEVLSIYTQVSA